MKKLISRIMLVSTVVLLAACQSTQTKEDETSNTSSSSQVSTSSDQQSIPESSSEPTSSSDSQTEASSSNTQTVPTVYQSVIDRYQANSGQVSEAINQDEVSSYLSLLTSQGQEYSGAFYSLYDIDQDGTYLFEGGGVYRIYQYNAMIPGLKRISESDTNPETSPLLDLSSLNWVKL